MSQRKHDPEDGTGTEIPLVAPLAGDKIVNRKSLKPGRERGTGVRILSTHEDGDRTIPKTINRDSK